MIVLAKREIPTRMKDAEYVLHRKYFHLLLVLRLQPEGCIKGKMNWALATQKWASARGDEHHAMTFYKGIARLPMGAVKVQQQGRHLVYQLQRKGRDILEAKIPTWLFQEGRPYSGLESIGCADCASSDELG